MLRRLYDWTLALADTRHAMVVLAAVAFAESSVFPIPPHALLVPMVLAAPQRAWRIAGVCTIFSVLGGAFGYWIGASLFDSVGRPVLEFYGKMENFEAFREGFNEYGAWAVLMAGITPFPYKVITITSGVTGLDFWVFTVSSIAARGAVFFALAAALWRYGPGIREFIERRFAWVTTAFFVLLIGGFAVLRLL